MPIKFSQFATRLFVLAATLAAGMSNGHAAQSAQKHAYSAYYGAGTTGYGANNMPNGANFSSGVNNAPCDSICRGFGPQPGAD
jgi:hypothetical protein